MGILVFGMVSGFRFLNPTSLETFHYSDNFQHHLSSVFFRNSPWSFPVGLNPQYGLIESSTLVYADPIPLIAVLFKIATPWIPASYQYLGLWTLLCFVFQAIIAWKLMSLVTSDYLTKILGTGFFLFTPFLLIRVGMHAALVSQFLLIAALYLRLSRRQKNSRIYWIALLGLSASINFYLFFLALVIWTTDLLDRYSNRGELNLKDLIIELLIALVVVLITFWQFGYFVGKTDSIAAGGFGFYQMNLLGPFDSQGWSYVLKKLVPTPPTIEGFTYFGLGIFILAPFAILKKSSKTVSYSHLFIQYRFFTIAMVCLFLLAISNRILFGKFLFEFTLPAPLFALGGIVRSSGRMFWPIAYLAIFILITLIIKKYKVKYVRWILSVALLIQIIDTSAGWMKTRTTINQVSTLGKEVQFNHPFWNASAKHYQKVISLIPQKLFDESWNWIPVAKFSAENKLGTNSAYLSRIVPLENRPINNAINESNFDQGKYESDSLYILSEQKILPVLAFMNPNTDLLIKADGMIAFAPGYKQCRECIPIDDSISIYKKIAPTYLNQPFLFNCPSAYAYLPYLLNGWAYPESWGTWSNETKATITLPLPKDGRAKTLKLSTRALVSPSYPEQKVKIWVNGTPTKIVALTKDNNNVIDIPIGQDTINQGYLILGFSFQDAISPLKIGIGDDNRNLAIGLISGVYE